MKIPVKFLRGMRGLPVGKVEQSAGRLGKIFLFFKKIFFKKNFRGSIYRVAGEGYFDTFLKGIFENLKI